MAGLTGNQGKYTWSGTETLNVATGFRWAIVDERPLYESTPFGVDFAEYEPGMRRAAGVILFAIPDNANPPPPSGSSGTLSLWHDGTDGSPARTGSAYLERLETGAFARGTQEQVAAYAFRFTGTITDA